MDLSIILNIELKRNWRFLEIGNRYVTVLIILFNFKVGSGMGTNWCRRQYNDNKQATLVYPTTTTTTTTTRQFIKLHTKANIKRYLAYIS
jgi:hypothetical protein